ncbi:MAG: hypothetical protein KC496_19970 [Anaerolineae bacterium]|nr:hypothetical protein [Anaerolineae bacterium]
MMSVALTMTWKPNGEADRLQQQIPFLQEIYGALGVSLAPEADALLIDALRQHMQVAPNEGIGTGRMAALRLGYESGCDFVHYVDGDRLIRWAETEPEELRQIVHDLQSFDCAVIGRAEAAFASHPAALRETERIINAVFSDFIGQPLDFGAGTKAFSRDAVRFLLVNSEYAGGLGNDVVWPVLCHRAGMHIGALWAEGMDWETADRFQQQAATDDAQKFAAEAYDADPTRWAFRVDMARKIIEAGLAAQKQSLTVPEDV